MDNQEYSRLGDIELNDADDLSIASPLESDLERDQEPTTPTQQLKFPKHVGFIVGQEFCERFSFYGMKAILPIYLLTFFDEDQGTTIMHSFVMFCYFFPLLGGFLSDSYLGKFRTILYLSMLYCLGNILMSATSIPGVTGTPPSPWGMFLSLLLIAVGTGGIKPCVASFGGDQFHPSQKRYIEIFFSLFYLSINTGSLISTTATPLIRGNVSCFGESECYPLAFGLPAILMLVATILFLSGSKFYTRVPPQGNVLAKVAKVVSTAISRKRKSTASLPHWLDHAISVHGQGLVRDVKALFGVLAVFIPVPVFWALFDQQSSRWTYQSIYMDRKVTIFGRTAIIQPDMVQVLNPLFVIALIPFFEAVVYPGLRKLGFLLRPLQKMGMGLLLCALSFIIAGFVQLGVNQSEIKGPDPTDPECYNGCCVDNCVSIWLQIPQYLVITIGEIMFSITGLEFAYSQAPVSMKSVCQAAWLLTSALGNVLVIVIAASNMFENRAFELFFFASLMFVCLIVFILLARRHIYVTTFPS